MDPEDFRRVREAFEEALDLPETERAEFAERAFAGEAPLRRELQIMLDGHRAEPEFLCPPGPSTLGAGGRYVETAPLRPGARVGDFELVLPIGSGGMGTVWEARQLEPARTVALKTVRVGLGPAIDTRRFREESRLLARLSHPGIAQILAAGVLEADGEEGVLPWFAMEYVPEARPLGAYLAARGAPLPERLELFLQVCDAVHHGHLRGVVHRDLKPDNLLVGPDGLVKVIDFGIARATELDEARATLTGEGEIVGTLLYMSPEQVRGERDSIDVRSDVHALGALLFEVLSGRPPWPTDESFTALALKILEEDPPPAERGRTRDLPRARLDRGPGDGQGAPAPL